MSLPEIPSFSSSSDQISATPWQKGTVWHYTTGAGLAGLVGDNVLWASAMAFMNDFRELRTGKKIVKKLRKTHVDDVEEQIRGDFDAMTRAASKIDRYRTFVACASEQPDRLTMWRNYTGEVGYAVALDGTKPLYMRRQRPMSEEMIAASGLLDEKSKQRMRDDAKAGSPKFEWTRVVYKRDAQYMAAWQVLLDIEAAAVARAESLQIEKTSCTQCRTCPR